MSRFFRTIRRFGILLAVVLLSFVCGCTAAPSVSTTESAMDQNPPSAVVPSSMPSGSAEEQSELSGSADASAVKDSFPTPQDTIRAFAKAIADEDFEAVLATCAVDEVASSYQLEEMTGLTQSYGINAYYMQSDGALFTGSNRYRYANKIAEQTNVFCASLAVDSETSVFLDGTIVRLGENDNNSLFKQYLGQLENKPWKDLQIIHMENVIDQEVFSNSAEIIATFTKQAARSGGDEKQEWTAIYACGERYFLQGLSMIRYGNDWKIDRLESALLNIGETAGVAIPMEGFDGMTPAAVLSFFEAEKDMP